MKKTALFAALVALILSAAPGLAQENSKPDKLEEQYFDCHKFRDRISAFVFVTDIYIDGLLVRCQDNDKLKKLQKLSHDLVLLRLSLAIKKAILDAMWEDKTYSKKLLDDFWDGLLLVYQRNKNIFYAAAKEDNPAEAEKFRQKSEEIYKEYRNKYPCKGEMP